MGGVRSVAHLPKSVRWTFERSTLRNLAGLKGRMRTYFVRIGPLGDWVRCRSVAGRPHSRGERVICRTQRGLEIGEIASECEPDFAAAPDTQGALGGQVAERAVGPLSDSIARAEKLSPEAIIVRPMTGQDELLALRLERNRRAAVDDCRIWLANSGEDAILLDVDQLFDTGTPIFYFLQAPSRQDSSGKEPELIARLAERFESRVRTGHFAKLLAEGCGPGCGTVACGDSNDAGTEAGKLGQAAGTNGSGSKRGGCSGGCAVCVVARGNRSPAAPAADEVRG